jgi:hypothetical protein
MRLQDVGARVIHDHYGDGTVTSANEYHTRIDFDVHGPRTFASSKVVLSPSTTAAPPKKTPARRKRAVA